MSQTRLRDLDDYYVRVGYQHLALSFEIMRRRSRLNGLPDESMPETLPEGMLQAEREPEFLHEQELVRDYITNLREGNESASSGLEPRVAILLAMFVYEPEEERELSAALLQVADDFLEEYLLMREEILAQIEM
ncbi:unnamed protein product [Zymoseptoria tritici ST99CH_1A5]|uniref:Uncharacterized protein n=1 Tax=Zymoseptoria tritici ST99CH_1A5 TaxID=1276529 RepID=A0A1Y6LST3_ZYMTR|nr:unnamed protein product [Zymoseptoria tritici ST99CH_1A5]